MPDDNNDQKLSITTQLTLHNGVKMPLFGLGTYKTLHRLDNVIKCAWDNGITHLDTAAFYENEQEIGDAIKRLNLPRDQLFITTKMWYTEHGYNTAIKAFETSLKKLGTDYVDLYLVHWPGTIDDGPDNPKIRRETWRAFEDLYKQGKCRAIGVSNYTVKHLQEMIEDGPYKVEIIPMVNQFELHPRLTQKDLVQYCKEHNIVPESYSPFAKGKIIDDADLRKLAKKYDKTIPQIILRWIIQQGIVAIPKSDKLARIAHNADLYDFSIAESDMQFIDSLNTNYHCTWNPHKLEY